MDDWDSCDACLCCGEYTCNVEGQRNGSCRQTCPCNPRSDYPPDQEYDDE